MPKAVLKSGEFTATLDLEDDERAVRFKEILAKSFRDDGGFWFVGSDEDEKGRLDWLPAQATSVHIALDGPLPEALHGGGQAPRT